MAARAGQAADDKRAQDIVILDLRNLTVMADYFVIASAETTVQVRAIGQAIIDALAEKSINYNRREGWDDARWMLLDYGGTIIHIFRQEERAFYDLERLWGDAPHMTINQLAEQAETEA